MVSSACNAMEGWTTFMKISFLKNIVISDNPSIIVIAWCILPQLSKHTYACFVPKAFSFFVASQRDVSRSPLATLDLAWGSLETDAQSGSDFSKLSRDLSWSLERSYRIARSSRLAICSTHTPRGCRDTTWPCVSRNHCQTVRSVHVCRRNQPCRG